MLVTPYVVRAVAQKDLSRPDDGFSNATDPQADLLGSIFNRGRLNASLEGATATTPKATDRWPTTGASFVDAATSASRVWVAASSGDTRLATTCTRKPG